MAQLTLKEQILKVRKHLKNMESINSLCPDAFFYQNSRYICETADKSKIKLFDHGYRGDYFTIKPYQLLCGEKIYCTRFGIDICSLGMDAGWSDINLIVNNVQELEKYSLIFKSAMNFVAKEYREVGDDCDIQAEHDSCITDVATTFSDTSRYVAMIKKFSILS